jgi:hypothetical protein
MIPNFEFVLHLRESKNFCRMMGQEMVFPRSLFSVMASFPCFRMLDYDWYVRFDSALVISLARNWLWVGEAIKMDMLRPSFRNRDTIRPSRIAMAVVDGDLNVCLPARNVEKGHGFVPSSWNPSLDDGPMFAADRDTCVSRLVGRSSIQSSQRSVIHSLCSLIHHGAPIRLSDQNLRPLRADTQRSSPSFGVIHRGPSTRTHPRRDTRAFLLRSVPAQKSFLRQCLLQTGKQE